MFELEGGARRERTGARRGETARSAQAEMLLERAVGEPVLAAPPERDEPSHLRPQNGRNVVWRWHVRRKPRSG